MRLPDATLAIGAALGCLALATGCLVLAGCVALATSAVLAQAPDGSTAPGEGTGAAVATVAARAIAMAIEGRPLIAGREGARLAITLDADGTPDDLSVRIESFEGDTVATLAGGPPPDDGLRLTWRGRDDRGRRLPSGAYRVVATATRGAETASVERWVTIAERAIYPQAPGLITIAVDPGHGGDADGAVGPDGTREADFNLDIGLRLARMLEGAGVDVVITRTSDANVNEPAVDLTADGLADDTDELAARPDLANRARADLFIAVHNNVAVNTSVGGPATFYYDERPFGGRSRRLARLIQSAMVERLGGFADATWEPFDHGALIYPYYVLRGYDPPRLLRPTQMPGVLSEGLFLSNPRELRLLKRPAVRQAMAEAYYDAIARYLASRPTQVGYALLDGPATAEAGSVVTYRVEVRNQGTEPMRGWRLVGSLLRALFLYEGRGRGGDIVGSTRIPRLEPGERATLQLDARVPDTPGAWHLVIDATDRKGRRESRSGSPPLQVPLEVTAPPTLASPSPSSPPDVDAAPSA